MGREVKIELYSTANDEYVELWKVLDDDQNPKFYAREVYGDKSIWTWYYVCDPMGYCELDRKVPDDVTFIICGEGGKEYGRSRALEE